MAHDDPFAGKTVNADWAYFLDTAGTYTPALTAATTDPNLGDAGAAEGTWHRNGHLITEWVRFEFAGAGVDAGSGSYRFEPAFLIDSSAHNASTNYGDVLGSLFLLDSSAGVRRVGVITYFQTTGNARLLFKIDDISFVTDSSPWTWAVGDALIAQIQYLADPAGLPT